MGIHCKRVSGAAHIAVSERFTFHSHREFQLGCESALAANEAKRIVVDLRDVNYLDSAALGMLLLLREKAKTANKPVSLAARAGAALDVLRIARFDTLFAFE
jgi:anti-anti-sigma factor